ncbi:MAG: sugar nucleotide-binding protein [candidate division Zixibacteria bacterium]
MITGVGGLLGRRLAEEFLDAGRVISHHHNNPGIENDKDIFYGDLGDAEHVKFLSREFSPDIIINSAALADVDRCQREPDVSQRINVDAIELMLRYFPRAKFVHISTDYVFPGEKRARPNDRPHPINIYGEHKLRAEEMIIAAGTDNLIIRTNTMIDITARQNFFLFVYNSLKAGKKINGASDQSSNPITTLTAAKLIGRLVEKEASGIYHIGGADFVSRYELALKIAEICKFDKGLITSVETLSIPRPAPRPPLAGLICDETEEFLNRKMPALEDEIIALRDLMLSYFD